MVLILKVVVNKVHLMLILILIIVLLLFIILQQLKENKIKFNNIDDLAVLADYLCAME